MLSHLANENGTSTSMFSLRQSTNGDSPDDWLEENFTVTEDEGPDFYDFSIEGRVEDEEEELAQFDGFTSGGATMLLDLDISLRSEQPSDNEIDVESTNAVYGRIDIDDAADLVHASTAYSTSSEFSVALSIDSAAGSGHFLLTVEYDNDFAFSASDEQEYRQALENSFDEGEHTISLAVYDKPENLVFETEITIDDLGDFE